MKPVLLFIFIFSHFLLYGQSISLHDENITIQDTLLLYKDKPYSGKMDVSFTQNGEQLNGFLNFKNGLLEGKNEITGSDGHQLKFNLNQGKYDGDIIFIFNDTHVKINASKDIVNSFYMKSDDEDTPSFDLVFTHGLANGTMNISDVSDTPVVLKNGKAKISIPEGEGEMMVSIDPKNGDMIMEGFVFGISVYKERVPNPLRTFNFQQIIFEEILQ